ncbi:glycerol-3-phosphate 1-O-acyltransferase PlsY [Hydrogenobacter hydrogenophilus]|uniref:Glycerol-3-phosphate acyltransferase n=1 Tax=Hydrogenobacter hydrogenophilus TaxID=35835 RepID=A0A285P3B3_9AQUI|nr:glycerol-3-phosphate 1-O-acyltransferase PlsY [Hydrogenobacter hydrogenophilus]SNZ14361.1 glycerol-3-phosphate acyltransferase PlsY [Hydrogenobacter hydrogenophilus]
MDSLLLIVLAYLLGSVLFGEHIARAKGIDIRSVGSGNVGATNVGRALGKKYALIVFLLDMLKGLFPVFLARLYFGLESWTLFMVGIASVLGHVFPIFHNFKGGKAVATAFGVLLGVSFKVAFLSLIIWLLVFKLKGYVSLASLVSSASAVFLLILFGFPFKIVLMSLVIASIIFYKHKDNISRLLEGTEHTFSKE